jgi:hypothetical protein
MHTIVFTCSQNLEAISNNTKRNFEVLAPMKQVCTLQAASLKNAELLDRGEHKLGLLPGKSFASKSAIPDCLSLEISAVKLLLETLVAGQVCAGFASCILDKT